MNCLLSGMVTKLANKEFCGVPAVWTRRWLCCLAHNWPNPLRMSCGSALRALFWAAKTVNFSSIWYGCTIFSLSTVKIMMSKKNYQENSGLWCCWLIVDGWSPCILTCQLHVDQEIGMLSCTTGLQECPIQVPWECYSRQIRLYLILFFKCCFYETKMKMKMLFLKLKNTFGIIFKNNLKNKISKICTVGIF